MGVDHKEVKSDAARPYIPLFTIGLQALVRIQRNVSSNVPDALDGSRRSITDYSFALCEEVHEVARELGWKAWKENRVPDTDRVIEEFADVMAFVGVLLINAAERCDIPAPIFAELIADQYGKTSANNIRRFENGKEKTDTHD
jgi:NTP pyrophosphatase (non-canonical NTP hydrolase)